MVEDILGNMRIKVALLSPGAIGKTAIVHFGMTFAKAMTPWVDVDYISEAAGECDGFLFRPIGDFNPDNYDVVHFQWGNNPLHFFEFSALLQISERKHRPLIVSTLHEAELGYLIGASEQASQYRANFKSRNGVRGNPDSGSDYAFFSYHTVGEILKRSDWVVVHSQYTKSRIIAEHQLDPEESSRIKVARLGIDWNDYAAVDEDEACEDFCRGADLSDSVIFLYVGSLEPSKSVDKVIKALHLVRHFGRRENFYFIVVGSGPERYELHHLAETLIPDHYSFAGAVPNVLPYYRLANVVVCPRAFFRGEVSGSIPEACAAGKPVILPNLGGWTEYVDESRGFPVEADDEIAYAEAILHCLENPDDVQKKGSRARRFAEEHLSWQKQAELFRRLYLRDSLVASK